LGLEPSQLAVALTLLAAEREAIDAGSRGAELVWTGPETARSSSRDTGVVVRELFSQAESSVLASGFVVYQGREIFKPLARRMSERTGLKVRLFLNISRPQENHDPTGAIVRGFADFFRAKVWPGERLPEVFYDPRALEAGSVSRAVLHAKCIVVDDARAFVTSANLTEAAQERNIEAGLLISDAPVARALRMQFETLAECGALKRAL
jgi:phosphatidylserine/phosphatidylglycerophosphate/cardiolipin synthase-like enzyme